MKIVAPVFAASGALFFSNSVHVASFTAKTTIVRSGSNVAPKGSRTQWTELSMSAPVEASAETSASASFIDTELRAAAMKLHTRSQAPKEGEAPEKKPKEPYATTRDDYMAFLVDSRAVYQAIEDVVNDKEELAVFRKSPLDRVSALDVDIDFMAKEYDLEIPSLGKAGEDYAKVIRDLGASGSIPEFMCHYYNFYFAHTAGGRMIGKQMSALLLDKKTLKFYEWDGNLNEIKDKVKGDIEDMVASWSPDERKRCTDETAAAFRGGGAMNSYLSGGQSSH